GAERAHRPSPPRPYLTGAGAAGPGLRAGSAQASQGPRRSGPGVVDDHRGVVRQPCAAELPIDLGTLRGPGEAGRGEVVVDAPAGVLREGLPQPRPPRVRAVLVGRSEERRVGKGSRCVMETR